MGLDCTIYMGEVDTERQALNVARMRLLGAEVIPVKTGSRTLKDAINEAFRDWVTNVDNTHYLLGTAAGAHPFPMMVRNFHRIIGIEARAQMLEQAGRLPDAVAACVGGGSNAIGIFHGFIDDPSRPAGRPGAGRQGHRDRRARRDPQRGHPRPAARLAVLPAAGRGRPDRRGVLDLGRPGLPGRRPGTRVAQGQRPRRVPVGHRRRGHGRVRAAVPHRGHHPGDRVGPRAGRRAAARPRSSARTA